MPATKNDETRRRTPVADAAAGRGLRLMQLREKAWTRARVAAFAPRLLERARAHGARVLLNGGDEDAQSLGFDGVHWSSARLKVATARPADLLVGASCHDAAELARAGEVGCNFAVLGPVLPTPSHPGATLLGWNGFARLVARTGLPVFALGGLGAHHLDRAIDCGGHGIAMRRNAWRLCGDALPAGEV